MRSSNARGRGREREPRSLLDSPDGSTLYTREEALAIAQTIQGYMTAKDDSLGVYSSLRGSTEFALNEVEQSDDSFIHNVEFRVQFGAKHGGAATDEMDDASLKAIVAKTEGAVRGLTAEGEDDVDDPLRAAADVNPKLWSESSLALTAPEARLAAIEKALTAVRAAGLVGAGHLHTDPEATSAYNRAGHFEYGRRSTCAYSVTVRTPDGTGSGSSTWEGEDWSMADVDALTARAIDLAQRSKNPVAVEPGRYTVVMTPDACNDLAALLGYTFSGPLNDRGGMVWSKEGGGNKLGLKVLDERISITSDPMDPEGGYLPFQYNGAIQQYAPATWIDRGVLKTLSYPTRAMAALHNLDPVSDFRGVIRMSSGPTSIDEMIASTTRGIFVNRFANVSEISAKTLFMTGVTRDGTFLIEKGKITKPIKNMRFEDSPLFFLNNLEAIGPARRVRYGNVMPPVLVRDFAFTSLTDAV